MIILIDTNVILDILQKREPFFTASYGALRKAVEKDTACLLSVSAVTDIFYILRRALHSSEHAKSYIEQLSRLVTFADVLEADIQTALSHTMSDFEDAVVDAVAARNKADYILTRNTKDFAGSVVPAVAPTDFLKCN